MRHPFARQADQFVAELFGEGDATPVESFVEATERDVNAGTRATATWTGDGPEPFFGDQSDQHWKVVGRPGRRFPDLRPDDLVVRRRGDGRSWRCVLGEDVDPESLYRRGPNQFLRRDIAILRKMRKSRWVPRSLTDIQATPEVAEVCGFFGPNDVRRTEQEIRDAVVARANDEWAAWHTTAGTPRPEGEIGMFGRLVKYYLSAVGKILPDTLIAMQNAAVGPINYAGFLGATTPATIGSERAHVRAALLLGAPGATAAGLAGLVENALTNARQANKGAGDFKAWSAAFVTACVRGATIGLGLETVIDPGRRQVGADELLKASLMHASYTIEARKRRAARSPRRGGYHAFTPAERAPARGDIIVQDRRSGITAAEVTTLEALQEGQITHGDIVVEVQAGFVVAIGGNLGDSSRKRRYPLDAKGFLVVAKAEIFTQEDSAGLLPSLPVRSTADLANQSTARIFAVLSPVETCAVVPGQPYGGGVLT